MSNLENMVSLSNNSRWISLFEYFKKVNEMILFRSKRIDGSIFPHHEFSYKSPPKKIERYCSHFKSKMWFEIITKAEESRVQLVKPKIINVTDEIIDIC